MSDDDKCKQLLSTENSASTYIDKFFEDIRTFKKIIGNASPTYQEYVMSFYDRAVDLLSEFERKLTHDKPELYTELSSVTVYKWQGVFYGYSPSLTVIGTQIADKCITGIRIVIKGRTATIKDATSKLSIERAIRHIKIVHDNYYVVYNFRARHIAWGDANTSFIYEDTSKSLIIKMLNTKIILTKSNMHVLNSRVGVTIGDNYVKAQLHEICEEVDDNGLVFYGKKKGFHIRRVLDNVYEFRHDGEKLETLYYDKNIAYVHKYDQEVKVDSAKSLSYYKSVVIDPNINDIYIAKNKAETLISKLNMYICKTCSDEPVSELLLCGHKLQCRNCFLKAPLICINCACMGLMNKRVRMS